MKRQRILFLSNHKVCKRVSLIANVMSCQKLFVSEFFSAASSPTLLQKHLCQMVGENRPFSSYEREASFIVFIRKMSFHSQANKTNFHI